MIEGTLSDLMCIRYVLPSHVIVAAAMPLTTPVPLPGEVVHVNGKRCTVLERQWWWNDTEAGRPALAVDVNVEATSV